MLTVTQRRRILPLIVTTLLLGIATPVRAQGTIVGSVVEKETGEPLVHAVVRIVGEPLGAMAGTDGRFVIADVPEGVYTLEASMIGYETQRIENLSLEARSQIEANFALRVAPISLQEIVVTPGRFAIMKEDPVVRQTLTEEDIHTIPQFGEDIYRAIRRLPGVSGNDISAKFTVRGGEHEEVLVLLDGLELYEPFHLKDLSGGVLSIVDVMAIGGIDMMTGGFPAQYGNRLSGVFDISSATPSPEGRTAVGISFMNARFLTEGHFDDGRGNWLLSARRGYMDIVLKFVDESDISPVYYDVLGKVQYRLDDRHMLSVHILHADDHLEVRDDESGDHAGSNYGNSYAWLRLQSALGPRLTGQTVASVGRVTRERRGEDFERVYDAVGYFTGRRRLEYELRENRAFTVLGLKQDWNWEVSERHLVSAGFDLRRLDSEYDYFNSEFVFVEDDPGQIGGRYDTLQVVEEPYGTALGLYASVRYRIAYPLTAEMGVRYDRLGYTGDDAISPRVNLVYSLGERTALRAGWGQFYQGQDINDLDVPYGESIFYRSQQAEHQVAGLEHGFKNGIDLRVEAYRKKLSHIRPRYENLSKDVLFAPELAEVSVFLEPESGEAHGVEVYLKRDTGGRFSWWGSYALARAEERFGGVDMPKNHDQRHTIYLDGNYRPNPKWRINLAWQYRSGWPYSERVFVRVDVPEGEWPFRGAFGPRNGVQLPAYHRLDLRVNRYFDFKGGRLSAFLEIVNLYARRNVRDILPGYPRYIIDGQLVPAHMETEEWFPLLPSIGASWEF